MQLSGRPLRPTDADQQLFVGRRDTLDQLDAAVSAGLNVLLDAEPGAGLTSLLNTFAYTHPAALLVSGAGCGVDSLVQRLWTSVTGRRVMAGASLDEVIEALTDHVALGGDELVRRRDPEPLRSPVALVDDVPADVLFELLSGWRDALWGSGLSFVFGTPTPDRTVVLRPPADAFFDVVMHLGDLTAVEALELVTARHPADPRTHQELVTVCGGNPRRLIRGLQGVLLNGPAAVASATSADQARHAAIAALGEPALALAQALEAVGGASASDQRLLTRLGWSRSRTTQVLQQLKAHGLVDESRLGGGTGRPRKVWRMTPSVEWTSQNEGKAS